MDYSKANPNIPIQAGVTTETKPEPGREIGQDQGSPATGAMAEINTDLQGSGGGRGGTPYTGHMDFTDDPLFQQCTRQIAELWQQSGMVPEQFASMLGQAIAQWATQGGTGLAAGLSCIHQCTAYLAIYGAGGPQGIGGGTQASKGIGALETAGSRTGTFGTTGGGEAA